MQALKEKFEASAHLKLSKNKGITWSLQAESKDVTDSVKNKDADMEDSNCARPVSDLDQGTPAVSQGSRHRHATKVARLSEHLKEQERIAASNNAIADALEDLESTVHEAPDTIVPTLPIVSTAPLTTPERDVGSTRGSFITGFTAVHRNTLNRGSASLPSNVTPSLATTDLLSGILLITNSAARPAGQSTLNPTHYATAPHGNVPKNGCGDDFVDRMYSLLHKIAPGSKGYFWFLQVGFKYLDNNDSRTTLLLGMLALMEILPGAIDGFKLHPLDETLTLLFLTSN